MRLLSAHRKIPKISPGAYIFQKALFERLGFGGAYIRGGLYTVGNLRYKIEWVMPIVEREISIKNYVTVPFLLCFILYLREISMYKRPGAYIRRGDLTEGFLR